MYVHRHKFEKSISNDDGVRKFSGAAQVFNFFQNAVMVAIMVNLSIYSFCYSDFLASDNFSILSTSNWRA